MLVRQNAETATIKVTPEFVTMLKDFRIFTREQDEECRWPLGTEVTFSKTTEIEPYVGIFAGNTLCSVGAFTYAHSPLVPALKVGRYCSIASGLKTVGARHPAEALSTSPAFYDRRVSFSVAAGRDLGYLPGEDRIPNVYKTAPIIEHDVWVANDCYINPGVTIRTGCVVARASVVSKSTPSFHFVGGNPGVAFKPRFPEEVSSLLAELQWWKHSPAAFRGAPKADPAAFADWLNERRGQLSEFKPKPFRVWEEIQRLL